MNTYEPDIVNFLFNSSTKLFKGYNQQVAIYI